MSPRYISKIITLITCCHGNTFSINLKSYHILSNVIAISVPIQLDYQFHFDLLEKNQTVKMNIKVGLLFLLFTFAELFASLEASETDENNNELHDSSSSESDSAVSPYKSAYNMDFMKGKNLVVGLQEVTLTPYEEVCPPQ